MPVLGETGLFSSRAKNKDMNSQEINVARANVPRTKVGSLTRLAQERALLKYPNLALEPLVVGDRGRNLMLMGVNSIRAELLDLATMMLVMEENSVNLTHTAVDRFFEWLAMFFSYLERYFLIEEDVVIDELTKACGPLKGKMKPSSRMVLIGSIQKEAKDMMTIQDVFTPSLPAGQRLGKLSSAVDNFMNLVINKYLLVSCNELSIGLNKSFSKIEIGTIRQKIVKYARNHTGPEEFLVLYTRWLQPKDLFKWKRQVLLRKGFQFFSYTIWEKKMEDAHFSLVGQFAEKLKEENDEAEANATDMEAAEFLRHKQAARDRMKELAPETDSEMETGTEVEDREETEYESRSNAESPPAAAFEQVK